MAPRIGTTVTHASSARRGRSGVTLTTMTAAEVRPWSFVPVARIPPLWWLAVALALVAGDYLTGPYFQFPAIYVVPVTAAAWFSGAAAGLALAVVLPLTRLAFMLTLWGEPWEATTILATAVTRVGVFVFMAVMAARLADHERLLSREVKVLASLLPVCTYCRQIRDADDKWTSLEAYAAQAKNSFSTGICPDCTRTRFPEYAPRSTE